VLGLPVSEKRVYMSFPVRDELFAGFIHTTESPKLLDSTDLVLALEIGMLPLEKFGEAMDVIDLESDPLGRQNVVGGGEYGSTLFPAIVRANCDSAPTLRKLAKVAESMLSGSDRTVILERVSKAKEYHEKLLKDWKARSERSYEKQVLDGWSIGHVLNEHWSKEMIWVDGSISTREGLQKTIELDEPGTYFSNPSYHLGAATGMSYGVALAYAKYTNIEDKGSYKIGQLTKSSKTVICTMGDGDAIFGNLDSALWTCSHYGIGVLYLILNNACWGIEWPPFEHTPEQWAKNAGDFEFLDLDNPRVDFSKIADAFSIPNAQVNTLHGFEEDLTRALGHVAQGKPFLIEIQMPKRTGPEPSVVP
jgi:thiamine pyrophosphate-dependent acetolactate synthase large subunit-like protein